MFDSHLLIVTRTLSTPSAVMQWGRRQWEEFLGQS